MTITFFSIFLKIIQAVQPHIVAVELCRARVGILQLDEKVMFSYAKNIDYSEFLYYISTNFYINFTTTVVAVILYSNYCIVLLNL